MLPAVEDQDAIFVTVRLSLRHRLHRGGDLIVSGTRATSRKPSSSASSRFPATPSRSTAGRHLNGRPLRRIKSPRVPRFILMPRARWIPVKS